MRRPLITTTIAFEKSLRQVRRSQRRALIPDVISARDYVASPGISQGLLDAIGRGELVGPLARQVAFPKPDGHSHRQVVRLNPLDEVEYHVRVGRLLGAANNLHSSVKSPRGLVVAGSWHLEPFGKGLRALARARSEWRRLELGTGIGRLDVANHFGTVNLNQLAAVLRNRGAREPEVEQLIAFLDDLRRQPGLPMGLPIGPEASTPLGTAYLAPIDRRLSDSGIVFARWMDDIDVAGLSETEFSAVVDELIAPQLERGGQQHAGHKLEFLDFDMDLDGSLGADFFFEPIANPAVEFMIAVFDENVKPMGKLLGAMVRDGDDRAIGLIADHEWIFERIPEKVAHYLGNFANSDEVMMLSVNLATKPWPRAMQACGVHACRVLRKSRYGAAEGDSLRSAADRLPRVGFTQLEAELHLVAGQQGQSEKIRRRETIEFLGVSADLNVRRALLASAEKMSLSRIEQNEVRRVCRTEPLLTPASEFALA